MSTFVRDLAARVNYLVSDVTDPKGKSIVMASERSKREVIPSLTDCGTFSKLFHLSEPLSSPLENRDNALWLL